MADRPINRPTIHTLAYRPRIFTVVWEMYAWLGGCANWLIAFTAANVGDGTNVVDTRYTEMIKSPAPQDHMAYVKRWGWLPGFTDIIHKQRRFVKLLQRGESTSRRHVFSQSPSALSAAAAASRHFATPPGGRSRRRRERRWLRTVSPSPRPLPPSGRCARHSSAWPANEAIRLDAQNII